MYLQVLPEFNEKAPCVPWRDRHRRRLERQETEEARKRQLASLVSPDEKRAFLEACRRRDREERERQEETYDDLLRAKRLRTLLNARRDNPLPALFVQVRTLNPNPINPKP